MSEKCPDITQNSAKLNFPIENIEITADIPEEDNKDDLGTFPFDHMYACNNENSELTYQHHTAESEVIHLKELLLLHLDLIQEQSEQIVNKDKLIANLYHENEMLKQRIERMERRVTLQKNNSNSYNSSSVPRSLSSEIMTHDSGVLSDGNDTKDNVYLMCDGDADFDMNLPRVTRHSSEREFGEEMKDSRRSDRCYTRRNKYNSNICSAGSSPSSQIKEELPKTVDTNSLSCDIPDISESFSESVGARVYKTNTHLDLSAGVSLKDTETKSGSLKYTKRRKRSCSNSSGMSNNNPFVTEERKQCSDLRKKLKAGLLKPDCILTTDSPYITQAGEIHKDLEPDRSTSPSYVPNNNNDSLEVPLWRMKVYTSCYSMEGTENLDDEVYNKRHLRLENDERRRKRWDVQRIREQRHIEKLRQRHEKSGPDSKSDDSKNNLKTFWPSLDDVKFIEVTEDLPVSAFGCPIPKFPLSEFRLPWLNGVVTRRKPSTKKSTRRKARRR